VGSAPDLPEKYAAVVAELRRLARVPFDTPPELFQRRDHITKEQVRTDWEWLRGSPSRNTAISNRFSLTLVVETRLSGAT
jgi:hypothetical protein